MRPRRREPQPGGVSRHRRGNPFGQRTTMAAGDDTSYSLTDAGGRERIVVSSTLAFKADWSALPHTTCEFVPPSVNVTSSAVLAEMAVTWSRIEAGSERITCAVAANAREPVPPATVSSGRPAAGVSVVDRT